MKWKFLSGSYPSSRLRVGVNKGERLHLWLTLFKTLFFRETLLWVLVYRSPTVISGFWIDFLFLKSIKHKKNVKFRNIITYRSVKKSCYCFKQHFKIKNFLIKDARYIYQRTWNFLSARVYIILCTDWHNNWWKASRTTVLYWKLMQHNSILK